MLREGLYMRRTRALSVAATLAIVAGAAHAGVIEIDSFHLGGFYDLDAAGMPLIPDNDMSFQNYFMGHTTVSGFTTTERRSFFAFDLSSLAIPDGEEIVSVSFGFELLFGGVLANFTGGEPEHVTFSSTMMPYDAIADPDGAGVGVDEVFDALGTGTEYAGFDIDAGGTPPGSYEVVLSDAALMDMEFAASMGEAFVISGKLDPYDPDPGALFEFVFGLSDIVVDGMPTGMPVPKLIITTAPIPAPSGVLVLAGAGLAASRRRR